MEYTTKAMEKNLRNVVTVTPKVTMSLLAPHLDTFFYDKHMLCPISIL